MTRPAQSRAVKKGPKLALVVLLVAAGGALAFAGALPEGYKSVGDVTRDPGAFSGREVELKASVIEGTLMRETLPLRFLITDGTASLEVRWDPALPLPDHEAGGTIEGKNVVVHGTVLRDDETGAPYLLAHDMQVGCASKYEPDRETA